MSKGIALKKSRGHDKLLLPMASFTKMKTSLRARDGDHIFFFPSRLEEN
ncbi:MAG: hypothetical protein M3O24_02650 [Thermoproteota archaeon]|nr:hypothetical protein [Thermoproteota archaeon]